MIERSTDVSDDRFDEVIIGLAGRFPGARNVIGTRDNICA